MSNPIPDSGSHRFADPEEMYEETPRNLLVPILFALFVVLAVTATVIHYTYHKSFASGAIPATIVYPIHTVSEATGQVVSAGVEDSVYLLPVVEVDNHISLPLFIESLAADVTTADGATYHCTGAQAGDFETMFAAYPELAQQVQTTGDSPLQRDTRIENDGGSTHGLVMVHFPISKDAWQHRQSASISISFYHQPPLVIPFPAEQ